MLSQVNFIKLNVETQVFLGDLDEFWVIKIL